MRLIGEIRTATNDKCPIHFDAPELGDSARFDPALLGHIFTNLLSNAVKYSPASSPVNWTIRRENGTAICTVRDQGIGIPEADLAEIFVAFHRARNVGEIPGSGLGLVIAKCCAELHGGTVEIESKVGEGTAVTVRLPLCAE
jgi:signal transduction histidine kinase